MRTLYQVRRQSLIGVGGGSGTPGPQGATGPQGPPGPAGTGTTFVHTQAPLSSSWVIVHNLNRNPSVVVVDSGDSVVIADVEYDSVNQVTVTFGSPTSGKAYLN